MKADYVLLIDVDERALQRELHLRSHCCDCGTEWSSAWLSADGERGHRIRCHDCARAGGDRADKQDRAAASGDVPRSGKADRPGKAANGREPASHFPERRKRKRFAHEIDGCNPASCPDCADERARRRPTRRPDGDVPAAFIRQLRADVAAGAGHDCEEWQAVGRCLLCDRPSPKPAPASLPDRLQTREIPE